MSAIAWTGCACLAGTMCLAGILLALSRRRRSAGALLAAGLLAVAASLWVPSPASPPAPMTTVLPPENDAVVVTIPRAPQEPAPHSTHPTAAPTGVEISPPPAPEPPAEPARAAPTATTTATEPHSTREQAQLVLLGLATPALLVLLAICAGPALQHRRRTQRDRGQWLALHELHRSLDATMLDPDIARLAIEDATHHARLRSARALAEGLQAPRPPRYDRAHLNLRDLAYPQALYRWADALTASLPGHRQT